MNRRSLGIVAKFKTRTLLPVLFAASCVLSACSSLPHLDTMSRARTGLPIDLAPVDELLMQADAPNRAQAAAGSVSSRANALRDRAARLRRM